MANEILNIPDDQSSAGAWKQWHIKLKNTFGRKTAATIFVSAWDKRGSKDTITHDLNEHLEKNGIILDKDALGTVTELGADLFDNVGDFFNMGKYLLFAVAGIAVVGTGILVFQIVRNPIESAKAAVAFTPKGAAAQALAK